MNALKIYVLMAVCIFGSLIGCDDGMVKAIPGHSVVKGKVTLNAEPLKSGVIRFHSTEEATKEKFTSAAITDGQYIMQATLGQNRVTISARGTSPDGSKFIELIPRRNAPIKKRHPA